MPINTLNKNIYPQYSALLDAAELLHDYDDLTMSRDKQGEIVDIIGEFLPKTEVKPLAELIKIYLIYIPSSYWDNIINLNKYHPNIEEVLAENQKISDEFRTEEWSRNKLDKKARSLRDSLIISITTMSEFVSKKDLIKTYSDNIREGLLTCFNQLFRMVEFISNNDKKIKAKEMRITIMIDAIKYMQHNWKRALSETLEYEQRKYNIKTMEEVGEKILPLEYTKLHLADAHWKEKGAYEIFVPAVDPKMSNVDDYHPGNILIYECRSAVGSSKRINYGCENAGNNSFSYHWYDENYNSMDIGGSSSFKKNLYTSVKRDIPVQYFVGDKRTQAKELNEKSASMEYLKLNYCTRLTNDQSFFLIFRDILTIYGVFDEKKSNKEVAMDLIIKGGRNWHLSMLINACRYASELSKYKYKDIFNDGIELFYMDALKKLKNDTLKEGKNFIPELQKIFDLYIKEYSIHNRQLKKYFSNRKWAKLQVNKQINDLNHRFEHNPYITKIRELLQKYPKPGMNVSAIGGFKFYNEIFDFIRSYNRNAGLGDSYDYLDEFAFHYFQGIGNKNQFLHHLTELYDRGFSKEFYDSKRAKIHHNFEVELERIRLKHYPKQTIFNWSNCFAKLEKFIGFARKMIQDLRVSGNPSLLGKKVGSHFPQMLFYFKSDAFNKRIILKQSYSHMNFIDISNLNKMFYIGANWDISAEGESRDRYKPFYLGKLGTNGYSLAPHVHIKSQWYFEGEEDDVKNVPPALFLANKNN